jgi:uncharacterized protein with NAD-binding domain and iron-sulfur cluster
MWIDPWVAYLQTLGVVFHTDATVQQIHTDGQQITHVTINQAGQATDVIVDYYVAALPVEVMTALLTPELTQAAPSLANLNRLRTAWMNGIQFYLAHEVPMIHGHAIYADSPWALTSVSQHQFWEGVNLDAYGDGQVGGILSVDISDWETPGLLYGRPAKECTAEEIKNEVWAQILTHLDRPAQQALTASRVLNWSLDPDIQFPNPSQATNLEPLLINTIHSLADRPEAQTEIPNLFLAADYVRTHTDVACMEAANEAARRAVNALLVTAGSDAASAGVWPLVEPALFRRWKEWDQLVFEQGAPHSLSRAVGAALRRWWPGKKVRRPELVARRPAGHEYPEPS